MRSRFAKLAAALCVPAAAIGLFLWRADIHKPSAKSDDARTIKVPNIQALSGALATTRGVVIRETVDPPSGGRYFNLISIGPDGARQFERRSTEGFLLPQHPSSPIIALSYEKDRLAIERINAESGATQSKLELPLKIETDRSWRSWLVVDQSLILIETPQSAHGRMVRIDLTNGQVMWEVETLVFLRVEEGRLLHNPAFNQAGSLFVPCYMEANGIPDTLCRFSLQDAALKERVSDVQTVDAVADQDIYFVLRQHPETHAQRLEARRPGGDVVFTQPLTQARDLTASTDWIAVTGDSTQNGSYVKVFDRNQGSLLWEKSTIGGEKLSVGLAARDGYFAAKFNVTPVIRVFDRAGTQVAGWDLETKFVVTTEFAGGFSEILRGELLLAPPHVLYVRNNGVLHIHRISFARP